MTVHPTLGIVEPQAECHDDAALQRSHRPAGGGPPPIPNAVDLLLMVREVDMPRERRSERAQGVGDLPFEVVQHEPGAFRNGGGLELFVEGPGIAREKWRGFGQSFEQVVDRRHFLIEAEGERLRGLQSAMLNRVSFALRLATATAPLQLGMQQW